MFESSCLFFAFFFAPRANDHTGYRVVSPIDTRSLACATRVRTRRARASERASGRDNESKRNRGDRAIDKTPNAARPRLILQAYTHPLVFSLSSPTTHPLDHYPLPPPPPPPPPLLSSPAPASFSATLRAPLTLRKSPSYPLRAPPSPNATHPLRGSPRTLGAADILHLSLFPSLYSLYLFSTLRIFS